ncbi:glycoside hydrolase family 88 protein [Paenibacillus sp. HB172176]|uniref:glycoside hydrolase family 88 protein n=1 Tax=Paenibacillus sp. HB172176 TaxID=2493690 RepID=UPI001F0D9E28|nr:glycoside hydrolase family 88 protein [Paenibacillus sp. HB172176]
MNKMEWANEAWQKGRERAIASSGRIGASFPHGSADGRYQLTAPVYWTSGFWPGLLWLLHRDQPEDRLRQLAEECESQLDALQLRYDDLSHDIGFMWTLTAVASYKLTGNEVSRNRALVAADLLAGRFNLKGRFIRAWNQPERTGWAIIDCMMNLPLLYWASEQLGDPRFRHIAEAHASTTAEQFLRGDGSVYHVVCFDPESGERVGALGGQGFAEQSAWARGTAWAIYGFALSYRHTGNAVFLRAAEQAAAFFTRHLPEDKVPYWDFRLPTNDGAPRDSSAAAIAASGLLELAAAKADLAASSGLPGEAAARVAGAVSSPRDVAARGEAGAARVASGQAEHAAASAAGAAGGQTEHDAAEAVSRAQHHADALAILQSLSQRYAPADGEAEEALLLHATGNLPMNQNIDKGIIYGDYYYMEALSKLRGCTSFWSPAAE